MKEKDEEVLEIIELMRELTRKEREAAERRGERVIPLPPKGRLCFPKQISGIYWIGSSNEAGAEGG